jgi:hypothetical protein
MRGADKGICSAAAVRCTGSSRQPKSVDIVRMGKVVITATTAGASRVASGLLCVHAIAITPAGSMELVRSSVSIASGLPREK